jgi:osmotically-inducible protein OsmY
MARRLRCLPLEDRKQDSAMAESDIVKRVHASLERDPRINLHHYPISIAMDAGDLILAGQVESIAAKKLTLLDAAETHGVQRIVDRLTVTPAEEMGDAEIRDHVCRVLLEEPAFERCLIAGRTAAVVPIRAAASGPSGSIVIEVKDGIVTLNGEVPSLSHKRLAGVLAWWVPGTRDVVNGLEEVPAEEDNDDELTDAVRLVLEKDPFVNASSIRASANDCVVTLEGLVPTEAMKEMAERDAWYVLGVKSVSNRIAVET